jgi:hypothetical protein
MIKAFLFLIFFLCSSDNFGFKGIPSGLTGQNLTSKKDSLENQILYNGRVWKNQFGITDGDQFFLSSDFLKGSIGVDGYNFKSTMVRYDLYYDELLIQKPDGPIIQLNKEMIDSFSLMHNEMTYRFINFENASPGSLNGYYHLLYDGKIKVYAKYVKELIPTTITNGLPRFSQINKVYILKDGKIRRADNRRELLNLFAEGEEQSMLKKYMRSNRIIISRNDPESFRRVIEYYETKTK